MTELRDDFYWLNDASLHMLNGGYLQSGVSPEQRVRNICDRAEEILDMPGFSEKFQHYKAQGCYSWSSPIWSNFGTDRGMPISCFGSMMEDSTGSILFTGAEIGAMSKLGGGASVYGGKLRHRGAKIGHDNGESNGSVSFIKYLESVTDTISQGGVRRGRVTPYLPIDHDDFYEFMRGIGLDGSPMQNITHAVTVTDDFMNRLLSGDEDAGERWARIIEVRGEIGYPYIMYVDTANDNTVDAYKNLGYRIHASNLCVAPETMVLTTHGYERISSLVDRNVSVWNGKEFTDTVVRKTGENQPLLTVGLDTGQTINCTQYHKFYVQDGYNSSNIVERRTCELEPGDKIVKFDRPTIEGYRALEHPYQNGFFTGDGTQVGDSARVYLYGEKRNLANLFEKEQHYVQENQDREYFNVPGLMPKFFTPDASYKIADRVAWFAGLIDSDGTRTVNENTQSVQITSTNKQFLKDVQLMLDTLGVESKIKHARDAGYYDLPANDGTGQSKNYYCESISRIFIGETGVQKLLQLGMETHRVTFDVRTPDRAATHFSKVEFVADSGRVDDTFCFTEHKRHMGVFNGILTGQCSEIMLPSSDIESFVCCLSSMNLARYDYWKDTDAVEMMVYFLDAVLTDFLERLETIDDPNLYTFMQRAKRFAERHRAIGIGTLGWHTYLQDHMLSFGSAEAFDLNIEMHKTIEERAWAASREMAATYGEPDVLKGYGRRHTTLTAIAPTRSSSIIAGGVSQSIEPLTSNVFPRDTAKGLMIYKNENLERLLESKGRNTSGVWDSIKQADGSVQHLPFLSEHEKDVFKTYSELDQNDIIEQAAMRQPWVDQGQSLNIMVLSDMPVKEINKLYIKAWKMGLKSLYYQYSKSAAVRAMSNIDCVSCEA